MKLLDTRRLPGPGIMWKRPGSIADVQCTALEAEALVPVWREEARKLLDALGWEHEQTTSHMYSSGVALIFSAPIDALYAALEVNDYLWQCCEHRLAGTVADDHAGELARLKALIAQEASPELIALQQAAAEHQVSFLSDDELVSVGLGKGCACWPVDALPAPDQVDWSNIQDIPLALITGTNGKTTSVRLASHVIRSAGYRAGMSSTDWLAVDGQIIEQGDYSGSEGARAILRQDTVDMAVLETARGGLLRRGVGVPRADAVLITNIAEDHLGDFGSQTLGELLAIKWVTTRTLDQAGRLILNADDPLLIAKARDSKLTIDWFSLDPDHPQLLESLATGGRIFSVREGQLVCIEAGQCQTICAVDAIPVTLGGAARHNVANALGVCALSHALGLPLADIAPGLISMQNSENPGRCNLFSIDDFQVLVDFAHNPHGLAALFDIARALPANNRTLCFAQAGDRTDTQIRELARGVWAIGLDRVIISELPKYYRGRAHGEIYQLLHQELLLAGAAKEQIEHQESEMDALASALTQAASGDLVIMLALGDRDAILAALEKRQQNSSG